MLETKSIFNRSEVSGAVISDRAYNLTIGVVLAWGFIINYLMIVSIPAEAVMSINPILLIVGYFVCCIAGTIIFNRSDNPLISFIGYNMVVVPIGIIITPFVQSFDPAIVMDAVMATGMVTIIMMVLGTMYPAFFFRIARSLFIALIAVIVVELFMIFIMRRSVEWIDWVVVGIFCGYIGYDWARANAIPKTLDNAVDSAAAIYIDIINIFIRILSIMGRRD
jgi:FtsH-binding integral membrane protein